MKYHDTHSRDLNLIGYIKSVKNNELMFSKFGRIEIKLIHHYSFKLVLMYLISISDSYRLVNNHGYLFILQHVNGAERFAACFTAGLGAVCGRRLMFYLYDFHILF